MAITIPGTFSHIKKAQLAGHVPAGIEPINAMAQRTHFVYSHHRPALFSASVLCANATTHTAFFPIQPSADGLSYDFEVRAYFADAATYSCRIRYGTASASGSWAGTVVTGTVEISGAEASGWSTFSGTIPANATYLEVYSSGGNHQLQHVLVRPSRVASIAAGIKPSFFAPFDDGFLTTGAPIHTEYINRIVANSSYVYFDRKWCLWSWLQTSAHPFRISSSGGGVSQYRTLGIAPVTLPDHMMERTVTARVKASDSGSPDGHIVVGQLGGDSVKLSCDGGDNSGTFKLTGTSPIVYAKVYCVGTVDVDYVVVDEVPSLVEQGTAQAVVQGVAPPASIEYLMAVETNVNLVYWSMYPVPGLNFHAHVTPDLKTQFSVVLGPGVKRLRCAVTRYIQTGDNASVTLGHARLYNTASGANAQDAIRVENTAAGKNEQFPPAGTTEIEKAQGGIVQWGSLNSAATVDAAAFPSGMDRLAEITESATSQVESFHGVQFCFGFGGKPIPSDDVTGL